MHAVSMSGRKSTGSDNECTVNYVEGVVTYRRSRGGLRGGPGKVHSTVDRFWAQVNRSHDAACWLFTGKSLRPSEHPHFAVDGGKRIGAHKYSWLLHRGPIPVGAVVCHHCDVPACVNPAHLFLGSQWLNVRDSRLKGHRRGVQKLTESQVFEIRASAKVGTAFDLIADAHSISVSSVKRIVSRRGWKHLPEAGVSERASTPRHEQVRSAVR
jgi:hypothetical protein